MVHGVCMVCFVWCIVYGACGIVCIVLQRNAGYKLLMEFQFTLDVTRSASTHVREGEKSEV